MHPTSLLLAQPLLGSMEGPKAEKMEDITSRMFSAVVPIFQKNNKVFTSCWRNLYPQQNAPDSKRAQQMPDHKIPFWMQALPFPVSHASRRRPDVFTFLCHNSSLNHHFFKFFEVRDLTRIICLMAKSLSNTSPIWKICLLSKLGNNKSASPTEIQKINSFLHAILDSTCICEGGNRQADCIKKNRKYLYDFVSVFVTKDISKCLYKEVGKFADMAMYHSYSREKIYWQFYRANENYHFFTKIMLIFNLTIAEARKDMTPDQFYVLSHHIWHNISLCVKNHPNEGLPSWLLASGIDLNASSPLLRTTPLMLVAHSGSTSLVHELIVAKANVNAADYEGKTPLFYAIEGLGSLGAKTNIVHELIAAKANVNMQASYGKTALVPALRHSDCSTEVCTLLLASGKHTHVVADYMVACLMGCGEGLVEA